MTTNTHYTYTWPYNGTTTTVTNSGVPWTPAPPPKPKQPSRLSRLGGRLASERGGSLPMIAGGSPDGDTIKKVEHKKKITLERKVGMPRDKGSGIEEVHKGEIVLVRAMEGAGTNTVGIKTTPKDGSGHVEIPIKDLRDALDELEETVADSEEER